MSEYESPPQGERIKADKVVETLYDFQGNLTKGYKTEAVRLGAYEHMLTQTYLYFEQPGVASNQQAPDTKLLIDQFFGEVQASHADIPIAFFKEVRQKLQEEKVKQKVKELSLMSQLAILSPLLGEELAKARKGRVIEEADSKALERLAGLATDDPEKEAIDEQVRGENRTEKIKETALDVLAEDSHFGQSFGRITAYRDTLGQLLSDGTFSDLQRTLAPYKTFITNRSGEPIYDSLLWGDDDYIRRELSSLQEKAASSDFVWETLVTDPSFPTELYHSFEELSTMVELGELAKLISDKSPAEKAQYLLDYQDRGISATILREIAEGSYVVPDDFLAQQVETYMTFSDNYEHIEQQVRKGGLKRWATKVAAATIAAAAVALPTAGVISNLGAVSTTTQAPNAKIPTAHKQEETPTPLKLPTSKAVPVEGSEGEMGVPTDRDPQQNASANEFLKGQKVVEWTLSNMNGGNLSGFYETSSAPQFDPNSQTWIMQQGGQLPYAEENPIQDTVEASTTQTITSEIISLPVLPDYAVEGGWTVTDKITGDDLEADFDLATNPDGTFFLVGKPEDVGKKVYLEYHMGPSQSPTTSAPTEQQLAQMNEQYIQISQLPEGKFKMFMEHLTSNNAASLLDKVTEAANYIRNNFLYSLDPSQTEYYHAGGSAEAYFYRYFDVTKGDCAIANSGLAMIARTLGVPTRMVYGFNNNEGNTVLTAASAHGIMQAYINGEWHNFDATPITADDYTKKALDGKMSQKNSGLPGLKNVTPAPGTDTFGLHGQVDFNLKDALLSIGDLIGNGVSENDLLKGLLIGAGVDLGLAALAELYTRKNILAVDELQEELLARAEVYAGTDDEKGYGYQGISRTEVNKLISLYVDHYYIRDDEEKSEKANEDENSDEDQENVKYISKRRQTLQRLGFFTIPLVAPYRLIKAGVMQSTIKKIPYYKEYMTVDPQPESGKPNLTEFFTRILGYTPKEISRRFNIINNHETQRTIRKQQNAILRELFEGIKIDDFRYRDAVATLDTLTRPTSAEEWGTTKRRTTDFFYEKYRSGVPDRPTSYTVLSKEAFSEELERGYMTVLAKFRNEDIYEQEMADDKKRKRRRPFRSRDK